MLQYFALAAALFAPALHAPWPNYPVSGPVVFIGNQQFSTITIYPANVDGPNVIGKINRSDSPTGLATDHGGNLYVANYFTASVTEYAPGHTNVHRTLRSGVPMPYSIAVDTTGTVYVGDEDNGIVEFAAGATKPTRTIAAPSIIGDDLLALDPANNLFILTAKSLLFEVPAGTTTVQPVALKNLHSGSGIAFDAAGTLYISQRAGIYVYPPHHTAPSRVILTSMLPGQLAFDSSGVMYVVIIQRNFVEMYQHGATQPFGSIMEGLEQPSSVAVAG